MIYIGFLHFGKNFFDFGGRIDIYYYIYFDIYDIALWITSIICSIDLSLSTKSNSELVVLIVKLGN